MHSDGAKIPPAPPLEYDETVARSFIRHRHSSTFTTSLPDSADASSP